MRALTDPSARAVRILPLGSPWSTVKCTTRASRRRVVHRGSVREGWYPGWCGRWVPGGVVYRVAGTLPHHPTLVLPGPNHCQGARFCARQALQGALLAPLRTPGSPHSDTRLRPIRARFRPKYTKVSHKSGVSTEIRHEACHSPCFKKGSISHDLEFPGFPLAPAFSHKE